MNECISTTPKCTYSIRCRKYFKNTLAPLYVDKQKPLFSPRGEKWLKNISDNNF